MNKLLKKWLSGVITASMIIGTVVLPHSVMADNELPPTDDLLVHLTFDEAGTGTGSFAASEGGTVTEHGAVSYPTVSEGNKALSIATNAAGNYLELPKGLFNGKEAITVSFAVKPSSGWAFMTTPVSGAQTFLQEKYLGVLTSGATATAERYNNTGTRLSSVTGTGFEDEDWHTVLVEFTADGTKLYVDSLDTSHMAAVNIASLFTADAQTWIGHGNWGSGEGFSGMIDDFRVYGKTFDDDTKVAIMAEAERNIAKTHIYENNCYLFETHFYDKDKYIENAFNNHPEIFSIGKDVKRVYSQITIRNYTENEEYFQTSAYAVAADGTETKINNGSSDGGIFGGQSKYASTEFNVSDIPEGTVKVVVKANAYHYDKNEYTVGEIYCGAESPVVAPADSDWTTAGAHDPSIVKFPGDDTYYVYSSHHLIFTSEDLINWKKYDFTNLTTNPDFTDGEGKKPNAGKAQILSKTFQFIHDNINSNVNGTYWAPDVIYNADDTEHPYWMYISVSCGIGGRNSAIGLIKSPTPLFWADPDASKVAKIEDEGVVFATKQISSGDTTYKTNAIDANIYFDSSDSGKPYFIWGSFWGGIQAAPLDGSTGFISGLNTAGLPSSAQNFGTSVFTQGGGHAGPEGAWMIEHGGYRYMFTSYGWLGSNYNTRVARAPLSKTFGTDMGTQLVDAKGTVMGTEYSNGSYSKPTGPTGYKLIGSYRLGDGTYTISTLNDTANGLYDYYIARSAGDAHIYYGPGHNSVINVGNETFYVSHTRKDAVEGGAYLQVRKLLWTEDGWPVVSPVTYAGEKEQALPTQMLVGTYDLASVGQTKWYGTDTSINRSGNFVDRNYDLPVVSSKVTLNADGTMAGGLGTWEADTSQGRTKLTLTFAKDGDTAKDEFYKSGDTMEMYALLGYDKDEGEPVIALTGIDENHITQFAKKSIKNTARSDDDKEITPIVVEKSVYGNPILGFGDNNDIVYGGDPSVLVDGDTVYIYAGHDTSTNDDYVIPEYVCYSSKDLKNWTYHGSVFSVNKNTVPWANDSTSAWAGQVLKHNGKYYMYYCTWGNSTYSGYQCIGVAVADSPTGPFTNLSETPLINGKTMTPENTHAWDDIDPTGWIETDEDGNEHIYLNWGNVNNYTCELNDDMVSVKGDIVHTTFKNMSGTYTEAPYLYRRADENGNYTGKYYLFFAQDIRERWGYATTDNIMGGEWDYENLMMEPTVTSNTSHGAVFDFNGKTYFVYHNGSLPYGSGYRRVANIQEVTFDENGKISLMTELSTGINGTASVIKHDGDFLYHENFTNPLGNDLYPLTKSVSVGTDMKDVEDAMWELVPGKADKTNEYYVSIQAVNKPGLYLQANSDKSVVLTQDATADTTGAVKKQMTFKTVKGLNGKTGGVSFESVSEEGYYLTASGGALTLTTGSNANASTFNIGSADEAVPPESAATVDRVWYENNETVHFRLNNAYVYNTVNAYVAEYESGSLIGVASKNNIRVTADVQFVDIPYTRKSQNSELKLYVWRNMQPAALPADVTETSNPYQIPAGYTSYFAFEDNLTATGTAGGEGTTVGWDSALALGSRITTAKSAAATYDTGYNGKAVKFTGNGSDGINLGNVITNGKYTISFRMNSTAITQFTSTLFITTGDGSNENWLSAPFGQQTGGNTMIWSKNNNTYLPLVASSKLNTNEWNMITITVDGTNAKMYVDGIESVSGEINNTVTAATNTYLGVNYWDTPFNGLIDELYVYNGTALTAEQVGDLYYATNR